MSSLSPSNKKKKETPTSFNDLPQETTSEIFARLPVKDLIRSTSVNKAWYSLINNPSFISSQISRCFSHCNDNALLIIPSYTSQQNYCSLISADTSSLIEKFDIPFETKTRSLRLIAQLHGMLLLTELNMVNASRDLYLWNPYFKRYRVLVPSHWKVFENWISSYYVAGMGYDKLRNDYKVVRILYVHGDRQRGQFGVMTPKVEVYSFRDNTWRILKDAVVPMIAFQNGTYVNGSFYWLEWIKPGTEKFALKCKELRILSFDFHNEVFGELKVPDEANVFRLTYPYKLMRFEGSLALCISDVQHDDKAADRYPYCLWLMRQENGVVSWTLRFRTVLKEAGLPLNITKNGTLIIESYRSANHQVTSIVSCDLKTMIYKDHGFGKRGGPEVLRSGFAPSTVDTSFPESLIMYEGGKFLLKYAK